MKLIAWNINGIRSVLDKDELYNLINDEKPDILCIGETKLSCPIDSTKKILDGKIKGYKYRFFHCAEKKGYSGTAIISKKNPINVTYGLKNIDNEGRVITLEYDKFYLIHVYTPNSGQVLQRLKFRTEEWDVEFRKYLKKLQKTKNIIVCGDLNVANEDIDIHSPKTNKKTAGFTNEERESFKKTLSELNLIDTYRYKHPDKVEYSYWSYRFQARKKNKGWRIDYFLVSDKLKSKIKSAKILTDVMGSDHAPVLLSI